MALVNLNLTSQYLEGNTTVNIILPDKRPWVDGHEFYRSGKKYKVLWLLHGALGDASDWVRKSNIEVYACKRDLIVVMPSALNSFYMDWSKSFMMGYQMKSFLVDELMPLVQGWFPASAKREDNYIAGLSMGGLGTLKYALNHPSLFCKAACLSFSPEDPRTAEVCDNIFKTTLTTSQMLCAGGMDAYIASSDNVWDRFADVEDKSQLPELFLGCGTKDFMYERFLKFVKHVQDCGIESTVEIVEGYGHEWPYWDCAIQSVLTHFGIEEVPDARPF